MLPIKIKIEQASLTFPSLTKTPIFSIWGELIFNEEVVHTLESYLDKSIRYSLHKQEEMMTQLACQVYNLTKKF